MGFGNGFLDPLPLADGEHRQGFLTYRLGRAGERWQFQNHAYGGPGFDFTLDPYDLPDFAAQSHVLQTAPDSGFVRLTVCHRFTPNGLLSLRGAVLTTTTEQGASTRTLASAAEYDAVLRGQFDLHIADSARLWEMVWAHHQAWLGQMQA